VHPLELDTSYSNSGSAVDLIWFEMLPAGNSGTVLSSGDGGIAGRFSFSSL
jgi:hypothetical protein